MKDFRKQRLHEYKNLRLWWNVGERNTPELSALLKKHPDLLKEALTVHESLNEILNTNDKMPNDFWESVENLLNKFLLENKKNRRVRKDVSRTLEILIILRNKTISEILEILNNIPPARHPRVASAGSRVRICIKDLISK